MSQLSPLLSLPLELRESIYSLYFKPSDRLTTSSSLERQGFYGGVYTFDLRLLRVSAQVCEEARAVWQRENVFIKIATPWPSAGMYRIYLMASDEPDVEDGEGEGESKLISRTFASSTDGVYTADISTSPSLSHIL